MMKVLEVNVDDVGLGGVYALVNSVIRNKPEGLKLDIACIAEFENPNNIERLKRLGTDVHYVGTKGPRWTRPSAYYRNTLKLLQGGGYDCVHIHGDVAYLLLIFARAARRAGVKRIILHSHAAGIDGGSRRLKAALHRLCRGALPGCATDFAACSDRAAAWMYPGLDVSRVKMVKNGVELERFAHDPAVRARVRGELKLEDAFVVGHVGRFAYQKNHEYLLDAFAAMRRRIENARLLLVGEGVLFDQIRAKAARLGMEKDVIFYGASTDVGSLMQAMDLLALPSRFEGLPVVGVEAQAAGLPVLFSDRITRQAALTDHVRFLPIDAASVESWGEAAWEAAEGPGWDRAGDCERVRQAGFTIQDTVRAFLALYGAGDAAGEAGGAK
ncbi:MAG: glycosyltransferase [Clostridia bacterium]|nr:glycosyltransferase [Clostridia bacterium]